MKSQAFFYSVVAVGVSLSSAFAQPPEGGGPDRGSSRGPGGRPSHPIVTAIDADGDHTLSAEEIAGASDSLLAMDRNGDGELTREETRPRGGMRGRRGEGPEGRGGPGLRGRRGDRVDRGDRGPRPGRDGRPGQGLDHERGPGPGAGGPPNPDQFVEHAMSFDANGDGMLDAEELRSFAKEVAAGPPRGGRDERPRRPR